MTLHADALAVLGSWQAPSPDQEALRHLYLQHLAEQPDAMDRSCHPDHLTSSVIIFSADHQRVLLTLHHIIKLWLQTGGHNEPDDVTLADAALREGREESGIFDLAIDPVPVLLSRHEVPSCGPIRPSHHLDVQFVAVAPEGAEPVISDESDDLAWFRLGEVPRDQTDTDVLDLIAAASSRLQENP